MRKDLHRPPHLYLDKTIYFITTSTKDKIHYFSTDEKKEIVLKTIMNIPTKVDCHLYAWIILNNHYHIEISLKYGKELATCIRAINGKSSFELNHLDKKRSRQVWQQYWDTCIRGEEDFWRRFNYIHHNSVKHGYVRQMGEYSFSSYNFYLKRYGREWLMDIFDRYPIIDFTIKADEF
jgi:putative transposase